MPPLSRALLVAVLPALLGCATRIDRAPLTASDLASFQAELGGRERARITVRSDGGRLQTFTGKLQFQPDRLQLVEGSDPREMPLGQITEIEANHAVPRGVLGAAIGLAAGVAAGVVIGLATGKDCSNHTAWAPCFSRGDNAVLFAIPLGLVGLVLGIPIGASGGAGQIWRFGGPDHR